MKSLKTFETKFETLGEGKIDGRASVWDVLDQQGDIVRRGAFSADLSARGNVRPILADHDPTRSVGLGRFTEKQDGLHVSIELAMDLQEARDAFVRVQKGISTGLSIGYNTVRDRFTSAGRELLELSLWETSIVVWPALSVARITSAKNGAQELDALLNSLRALKHLNGYNELLEQIRTTRAKHAAIRAIRSGLRP
jgi:HK97 family phage prohead protease